jgi:predicted DNA-binding transcriptional regulator AlpA
MQAEILDINGAAALLGCSTRAVHVLRHRQGFPKPVALLGAHRVRWRRSDLLAWIVQLAPAEPIPAPERLARGKRAKKEAAASRGAR